jgi:hypothetical protein
MSAMALLAALVLRTTADPFTNGGFELPQLAARSWISLPPGGIIPGWTIGGSSSGTVLLNGLHIGATEGSQYLGFSAGSWPAGGVVAQTFDTKIGQRYLVGFRMGKIGGSSGRVAINATVSSESGTVVASYSAGRTETGWGPPHSFEFVAASSLSTLRFQDTSPDIENIDLTLDDVTLQTSPYNIGFSWKRSSDWKVQGGGDAGTENGNPAPDSLGNPVWSYEWIQGGGGLGTPNPWYTQPGQKMVWDTNWFATGMAGWVRADEVGNNVVYDYHPFTQRYYLLQNITVAPPSANPDLCPIVRWLNPVNESLHLGLAGTLRVTWSGDPGSCPVNVDLVIAQVNSAGKLWTLFTNTLTKPHSDTSVESVNVPVDLSTPVSAGDSLLVSLRADGECPGTWIILEDSLTLVLQPTTPLIETQPANRTVTAGSSLQISVAAKGAQPLRYRWQKDGVDIPGFTNSVLTLHSVSTSDSGEYRAIVANEVATALSESASLTVRPQAMPPLLAGPITNQANGHLYYLLATRSWVEAESAAVSLGGHLATIRSQAENDWIYATFGNYGGTRRDMLIGLVDSYPLVNSTNRATRISEFAWVSGEPMTFTWWWTNEPNNRLDLGEFYGMIWGFGIDPSGYWNDISDGLGDYTCALAEVPLEPALRRTEPTARKIVATSSVSFSAVVSGLPPLVCRWYRDGEPLPEATNNVCTVVGVQSSDAGAYTLVVSNAFGSVTGLVANLTVLPFTPPTPLAGPITNPANDHLYYLLDPSSWVEAEAASVALGGHLATIRNQAEQEWICTNFSAYGGTARHLHIGLYDPDPLHNSPIGSERRSEFVWVNGEPVSYVNWHPIEPNNSWNSEFHVNLLNPAIQSYATGWPGAWNDQWDQRDFVASGVVEVIVPPFITAQPSSQWTLPGSNIVFAVAATGSKPLSYQWQLNGTNLPGATTSVLNLKNVTGRHAGSYVAIVTNRAGAVASIPALLDVRYLLAYGDGVLLLESNSTFVGSVELQLWSVFPNGNIFYTLDGSAPSFTSSRYLEPVHLNRTATVRAMAYSADFSQQAEATPFHITIIPTYTLTALTAGGGTISLDPPFGPYASNTWVTVTASASPGWTFLGWLGDTTSPLASHPVLMTREKHLLALFGTSLSTTITGGGSLVVDPQMPLYPFGTKVRITATPQPSSQFATWGSSASGTANPFYLIVTNALPLVSSLFVSLEGDQTTLTVVARGQGKVTRNPQANAHPAGTSVILTATPEPGQSFLGWSGDAGGNENPLTVVLGQSQTITATFTDRPQLSVPPGLAGLTQDGFRGLLTGNPGGIYQVLGSADLSNWAAMAVITNFLGTAQFTDPAATIAPTRFYRAAEMP